MKKFFVFAITLSTIVACNNGDKKTTGKEITSGTSADSLMLDIEDGHNIGMSKMSKLSLMQNAVQQVLDSISELPDKAQETTELYKRKLNGILEDLKSAKDNMYKWMDEFNRDSAINDLQQRINYLTEEKMKVAKVKETILNTLQKADSLLKSRF